jgi:hypothetical protein
VVSIRILACRVGRPSAVEELANDLGPMQAFVGGLIEAVGLGNGLTIVCNDDGAGPFNRAVPARAAFINPNDWDWVHRPPGLAEPGTMGVYRVHGDFFVARTDDEGEFVSLTDADLSRFGRER